MYADIEARFTSVERLDHYLKTLKREGDFETHDKTLKKEWPRHGGVEFENVSVCFLTKNSYLYFCFKT